MIELYSDGAMDAQVCVALKLPHKEFEKRYQNDSNFSQLVDYGRHAAKAWWLEIGRKAAKSGSNGGYSFWVAYMKNQFGWTDKTENTEINTKSADTQDLKSRMAALQNKIKGIPNNADMKSIMDGNVSVN